MSALAAQQRCFAGQQRLISWSLVQHHALLGSDGLIVAFQLPAGAAACEPGTCGMMPRMDIRMRDACCFAVACCGHAGSIAFLSEWVWSNGPEP